MKKWMYVLRAGLIGCVFAALSVVFCVATAAGVPAAAPESEGGAWLSRLQRAMKDLGSYTISFELSTEGYALQGTCSVSGENYYIALPEGRVYCDGKVRYEVNDRTREVVIDRVDLQADNLLDNPVRAFDLVDRQYQVFVANSSRSATDRVTLSMTPREKDAEVAIRLSLNRKTALPVEVIYGQGSGALQVKILGWEKMTEAMPAFRAADYAGYELIDFR